MSILANSVNLFGLVPWIGRRFFTPQKPVTAAAAKSTRKLSPNEQWERLSGVVSAAIASATNARELQAGAAQQLDLATYALYNLFDELTSVMSEPLVREAAVVHRLQPKATRRSAAALAA
mgnify:FL=1